MLQLSCFGQTLSCAGSVSQLPVKDVQSQAIRPGTHKLSGIVRGLPDQLNLRRHEVVLKQLFERRVVFLFGRPVDVDVAHLHAPLNIQADDQRVQRILRLLHDHVLGATRACYQWGRDQAEADDATAGAEKLDDL